MSEAMRHDREENKQGSLALSRSRAGTILQPWFNSVIFKLRFIFAFESDPGNEKCSVLNSTVEHAQL